MTEREERWLTYVEAGELLGISPEAVRQRARRYKWPRRTPNEHGAVARVLMPDIPRTDRADDRPQPALNGGHTGYDPGTAARQPAGRNRPDELPDVLRTVRETVEFLIAPIREQLDHERRRADRAEQRADEAVVRADRAEKRAADAIARADLAELRVDELLARQATADSPASVAAGTDSPTASPAPAQRRRWWRFGR